MKGHLATVHYEDKMQEGPQGVYPLHDLVMRMVEDDKNGKTWLLHKLVDRNPRKGIDQIIKDVQITDFHAGAGKLLLLVDRDRVAEHLKLSGPTTDAQVVAALKALSDASHKLEVFFLKPNLEGLLRAIKGCEPSLLPESMPAALKKNLNERDLVFKEVKNERWRNLRNCVRHKQPGLDALAKHIASIIPKEAIE